MGAVTFSIDLKLIKLLSEHLTLDVLVETGTFQGNTITIAKDYFKHIYSIELSKHYYEEAVKQFGQDAKITLLNDDSARGLETIRPDIQQRSVIFWLDAHWCVAHATAGELSQCPLLEELSAIQQLNDQSLIIIDDARLFLTTPPKPHETSNWPSLHAVIKALFDLSDDHRLCVVNDCILFFPKAIETHIKQFSAEHAVDWLDIFMRCQNAEALLIKVCEENEMLHNLGFWKRVRGLLGYIWRKTMSPFKNMSPA